MLASILLTYSVYEFGPVKNALGGGWLGFIAALTMIMNFFRMMHGLIVSLNDPRYEQEIGGDFNPLDMVIYVAVLLFPYICLYFVIHLNALPWLSSKSSNEIKQVSLIALYMLPYIPYFCWDWILKRRLEKKWSITIRFIHDCVLFCKWPWKYPWKKQEASTYKKFLRVWLGLDFWVISLLILLILTCLGVELCA